MKYIIDIPNEMVIKSPLNGLTLGIAMIETSTQKQFIIPTNISLMPYIEPQKWVSCSERMPELYKPVLVTGGDIIWICELIESPDLDDGEFQWEDKMLGHWYSFDDWDAWMPLPEPWKEEKDETD